MLRVTGIRWSDGRWSRVPFTTLLDSDSDADSDSDVVIGALKKRDGKTQSAAGRHLGKSSRSDHRKNDAHRQVIDVRTGRSGDDGVIQGSADFSTLSVANLHTLE